ncbi:MAG TPA: HAD family hydrolase [Planctomycetota bacterium]|nr:HAD family hydrolase [Planctomycetota bacterium]
MPGFIFFDIDDTLLDDRYATAAGGRGLHGEFPEMLPGPADEFARLWLEVTYRHIERWMAGECSHLEQRRARVREVWRGGPLSDAEADRIFCRYWRHYEAGVRLFPDALPCLEALAGRPVGIITNGASELQRAKLRQAGLLDRFSPVLVSGDIGIDKPDPRIFQEAARLAGRAPLECLYVGDRLETDALAAARAGMTGVWLDRTGSPEAGTDGIAVINGLEELPMLIQLWDRD